MKVRFNFPERAPVELNGNGRFVIPRQNFVPAYVLAFEEGVLNAIIPAMPTPRLANPTSA